MKNTGTLQVTTPGDREIVMTRVFDAPRNLVWDAFTKPELLKRWFGPRGWSMVACEVDLRVTRVRSAPAAVALVELHQPVLGGIEQAGSGFGHPAMLERT